MPDINMNGTTLFYNDEGHKDAPVFDPCRQIRTVKLGRF